MGKVAVIFGSFLGNEGSLGDPSGEHCYDLPCIITFNVRYEIGILQKNGTLPRLYETALQVD